MGALGIMSQKYIIAHKIGIKGAFKCIHIISLRSIISKAGLDFLSFPLNEYLQHSKYGVSQHIIKIAPSQPPL